MKVLVAGYGSIGKRHVRNLSDLEGIGEIFVYTKIKGPFENASGKNISFIDASSVNLETAADRCKVDFAIIANETFKHVDTAMVFAARGAHLFIEKPLSHNGEKIDDLSAIVQKNRLKAFVAYNLRFLPAVRYLKDQIFQKTLGRLYFAQIEVGQYLPSWRSGIRYSDSYSAHTEYGGGVALDLSHEVDYMRFLFGEPESWKTVKSRTGELDINSEDIFEGIYKYAQGLVCHVHMDYLQRKAKRTIRIVGEQGEFVCDFIEKHIDISTTESKSRLADEKLFDMAETYKAELNHFIEIIECDGPPAVSLEDGRMALKMLEDSHDRKS